MKNKNVRTFQELVTPKRAAEYLSKNKLNRPLNVKTVELYAKDMANGNWLLNHQGIAFNDRGDLIDGQHRLAAIQMANIAVLMLITVGLSSEKRNGVIVNVMDTVDRLRVRGIGQQLGLFHGIQNGNRVAAICKAAARFFFPSVGKMSTSQTLHIVGIYGADMKEIYELPDANKHLPAYIGAPIVLLHNADPAAAIAFTSQFLALEGVTISGSAKALHTWLNRHPNANIIVDSTMKVIASCLYHFVHKTPQLKKVYASEEAYHWLVGLQKGNERKVREILGAK